MSFDRNFEDFVREVGLEKVSEIVLNCPEGFDTYLKSSKRYIKRSKQLYYSSDEVNVDKLAYVSLVSKGISCGESFKDKLYEKRARELLEKLCLQ